MLRPPILLHEAVDDLDLGEDAAVFAAAAIRYRAVDRHLCLCRRRRSAIDDPMPGVNAATATTAQAHPEVSPLAKTSSQID